MRNKYPSIHGGADYVLPIMLTSANAPVTGTVVATYRVGAESVRRNFSDVSNVGEVVDPTNPAYTVHRYDCIISAADATAIGGTDSMVQLDINVTISGRTYQALGAVVPYYAFGGPIDAEPVGAHIVVVSERLVATVVNVLASGGGGDGNITADQISDSSSAGRSLLMAVDVAAQLELLGLRLVAESVDTNILESILPPTWLGGAAVDYTERCIPSNAWPDVHQAA